MILRRLLLTVSLVLLFAGCSSKEVNVYNKPALYWYQHIVSSIADDNLDKADNYYSSLQGEHIGSPLLREATLILAIAHLKNEEYLLSTHFLNEYIKRYANPNEKEYCEYLKVKATYLSLPRPRRNQDLLNQAIREAKVFEMRYPTSQYYDAVDTMLTKMYISRALFDKDISRLYKRIDKPLGAQYYSQIDAQPWVNWALVKPSDVSWYREWFVGNGKSSWYGFMIPDTINVVSRNSYKEEIEKLKK